MMMVTMMMMTGGVCKRDREGKREGERDNLSLRCHDYCRAPSTPHGPWSTVEILDDDLTMTSTVDQIAEASFTD